jgi:tetratricopeptide (TPR) repeat protein
MEYQKENLIKFFFNNWDNPEVISEKISDNFKEISEENDLIKGFLYHIGFVNLDYLKNLDKAEKCYNKFFEKNPNNIYCLHILGVLYTYKKEYSKAEEYCYKALEIDPKNKYALDNLKQLYNNNNTINKIIELTKENRKLKKEFREEKDNREDYRMIKQISEEEDNQEMIKQISEEEDYQMIKQISEEEDYRRLIMDNLDYPEIISEENSFKIDDFIKGSFYYLGILDYPKDIGKAEECYKDFLDKNPNNIYAISMLGCIYYSKTDVQKSRTFYNKLKVKDIENMNALTVENIVSLAYNYDLEVSYNLLMESCYKVIILDCKSFDVAEEILLKRYTKSELLIIKQKYILLKTN